MRISIEAKIIVGFSIAFLAVMVSGYLSRDNAQKLIDAARWSEHTSVVLDEIERTRTLFTTEDLDARRYVLAGDTTAFARYLDSRAGLYGRLATLRQLTDDNPSQQRRIDTLYHLIDASFRTLSDAMAQRLHGGISSIDSVIILRAVSENVNTLMGRMRVEENGLRLVRDRAMTTAARTTIDSILVGVIGTFLLVVVIAFVIIRSITKPLRRLTEATEHIGRKNYTHRIKSISNDEMGDLAMSFNVMAENLERGEAALQDIDRLFAVSRDLICITGPDGYFKRLNPAWERVLGYTTAELLLRPNMEFMHPDDHSAVRDVRRKLAEGQELTDFEIRYRHRDGTYRWFSWNAISVVDQGLTFSTGRDITERRRLEEERLEMASALARQNTRLQELNSELESFSYSVSHDLRAPLRSIDGFSHVLLSSYTDSVDDQGKDYLRRVRAAAQRMGRLIDDILELSRLSRIEMRHSEIDLSQIGKGIASELTKSDPNRQVEFHIEEDVKTQGDERLLAVALDNLLRNSWKYTSKHASASISFGVNRSNGTPIYYVRDDGAGFDMAYADKLFAPFQRLHGMNEFEGTGVGLATVRRIISRHGGRIWTEAAVEQGATFYFTLSENHNTGHKDDGQ